MQPRALSQAGMNRAWFTRVPDPHSLGVLDGPVQGAEKRAALLHHAVEVGLVEEVTLGVAEVLGAKPGRGASRLEETPGLWAGQGGWWGWPLAPGPRDWWAWPSPLPCSPRAPHLRRYTFQGSDSFS